MESILTFNGHDYRLTTVSANVGPAVEIKAEELNTFDSTEFSAGAVTFKHDESTDPANGSLVVFYKQEGKYTVLLGRTKVQEQLDAGKTLIKGRLISSPALKKARIEVLTPAEQRQIEELANSVNERRNYPPRGRSSFQQGYDRKPRT